MWPTKVQRHFWYGTGRNISFTAAVNASHYDVLGITPKATQAEVKAAYYEKSKLHHPDTTSKKSEGSEQFRLITEAYEVLGNYKTRQLYDRGLYGHSVITADVKKEDPKMGFYRSRFERENIPKFDKLNKKSIYNFDEWTRQHYSESYFRSKPVGGDGFSAYRHKGRFSMYKDKREYQEDNLQNISPMYIVLAVVLLILVFEFRPNYDVPKTRDKIVESGNSVSN